ncbi:MAG: hypothetical protein GTO42_01345 [Candidatus Latescibacteria bacterium]|nr:hypothetical protein [Candidatus Latescibacterota bacterium]NIO27174.1 hypothetical protein [Candidatus Latescibacterota bacterium]NIO54698.1 hypothetical protein [Candidatus Latescibacterota bacterium]NIT00781.1 hypothetical protein [Candidatus Latescibacterota bacterium]NIT37704.1 hypothetical protein [Candidatus Latescibacterota bacterium]
MTLYLLTIGFISILGQVVILRELNVAFYGIELIYILAMGIWLLWSAAGALIGRRAYAPPATVVRYLFILFSLLLPVDVAFIRGARVLFGGIPGSYLPFGLQLAAISIALLPIGILIGLLFQWAAKLYIANERTLALAYAIESAGGLVGGLASTLLLKFGIQNFTIAIICSLVTAGILLLPAREKQGRHRYGFIAAFGIFLVILLLSPGIDHRMTQWTHPNLFESRDSPYSRITIDSREDQLVMFENDAFAFETESAASEELVHLAAVHHDNLKDVLILGGGVEGLLRELSKHSPQSVIYVELNPVLLALAEKHLPEAYKEPLRSKNVTVRTTDPRNYLKSAGLYDLILVGMPEPTSGQSNRFFTREFFAQCSDRLKPGGVLAFRLRSSENIWTQLVTYRNTSIHRSLKSVFQDLIVLPGVTNTIIASNASLSRDPETLIGRFNDKNIETRLVTPEYIHYLYTNDRFFEIANRIASANVPANTDIRPVCYRFSSMIWLSKFIPQMINWDPSFFGRSSANIVSSLLFILGLGALFLLSRRKMHLQRITLAALAGFIGMVLETILILHYQVKSGVLFQNIGILLMVFMAGLAVGSVAVLDSARAHLLTSGSIPKSLGRGLFIGFGILNLIFIGLLKLNYASGLLIISVLLFLAGFFVSGIFAYASLSGVKDQKIVVSPLYAADLLGGCIGSLLGSLLLIPLLGMTQSAAVMLALAVVALILV